VEGIYPVSAVTDMTGGLNITLFSYDGSLDFGLIACREMVPDVWNLIGYLQDAMAEMLSLLPAEAPHTRKAAPGRKAPSTKAAAGKLAGQKPASAKPSSTKATSTTAGSTTAASTKAASKKATGRSSATKRVAGTNRTGHSAGNRSSGSDPRPGG